MIKNSLKEALKEGSILEGKNFRYKIVKVLGLGSYGITYLADIINAEEERTNMQVALKELFVAECNERSNNKVGIFKNPEIYEELRRKFSREAENLHKINHSNIINVYEWFEANDTVYYAMTHIEGGSLARLLSEKGKLREHEALETAQSIANALDEIHNIGLLHLDVRPDNILMNGGKVPVLIDFGLAKHFNEKGEPDTSIGLGNGVSGYAPMEQASYQPGNGVPRSIDVYSLGATIFKMLTGEEPPTSSEIFNYGFPKEVLEKNGISNRAIEIVETAMKPLWKDRYESAGRLEKAIRIALDNEEKDQDEEFEESPETIPASVPETEESGHPGDSLNEESDETEYNNSSYSLESDTEEETEHIASSSDYESDDATSIESDSESTSIDYSGYEADEGTQVDLNPASAASSVVPPMIPQNEQPGASQKNKRFTAYLIIGCIIAVIAILIGSDLYTGWIRELFRTPVECVVLEADESDIEIENNAK